LKELIGYSPSEKELAERRSELKQWKERTIKSREHETDQ